MSERQTLNFASLQKPVSLPAVLAESQSYSPAWRIAAVVLGLLVLAPFIILVVLITIGNVNMGGILMGLFLWLAAGLGGRDMYKEMRKNVILRRFAADNQWLFAKDLVDTSYPGDYFRSRFVRIADRLRTPEKLFFELGNMRIVGQQERSYSGPTYGYLRIKLPRQLPHMMLQSKSPNALPIAGTIDPDQRLSLEGNWDHSFTLYAPKDYETDALYVFTPDIMQKFMDHVGQFNCEIVDDELYFFSPTRFDLTKPAVITGLLELISDITRKFDRQIAYYSDANVGNRQANVIAQPGRRLHNSLLLRWLWRGLTLVLLGLVLYGAYVLVEQAKQAGGNAPVFRLFASFFITLAIVFVVGAGSRWWQRHQK